MSLSHSGRSARAIGSSLSDSVSSKTGGSKVKSVDFSHPDERIKGDISTISELACSSSSFTGMELSSSEIGSSSVVFSESQSGTPCWVLSGSSFIPRDEAQGGWDSLSMLFGS